VWFDFVLFYFRKQKNFIVSTFAPNTIPGSNPGTGRRFEHNRLARWEIAASFGSEAGEVEQAGLCGRLTSASSVEPRTLFGRKVATKKNLFQADPLPMIGRLRAFAKRYS
jgi:hypothetical protein